MKNFARLILQGILLVAPLTLTFYILFKVFTFLDSILDGFVGDFPGLGILLLLIVLVLAGLLGDTFITDPLKNAFNKWLAKIPLIKIIYDGVKDLLGAFVGDKKKFTHPVIVKEHQAATCYKIGFITQESLEALELDKNLSAVYFPHSYAFSGVVMLVENDYIKAVNMPAADVMKFIVSGGVMSAHLNEDQNA